MISAAAWMAALVLAPAPLTDTDVPSFDRWRATTPGGDYPSCDDYLRVLSRWPRYAERDWNAVDGEPTLARYKADEVIMLGLAYALHRLKPPARPFKDDAFRAALRGGFQCPEAEIVFRHDDDRFVGWSTKTRTRRPQVVVGLPGDSALPQWQHSLCGSFGIEGANVPPVITSEVRRLCKEAR